MPAREDRYAEMAARMTRAAHIASLGIVALTLVEVWGDWRAVAVVIGVQAVLMPFNTWVTRGLLPRRGAGVGETVRTTANLTGVVVIAVMAGFPNATWLWLPFVALTFDNAGPRIAAVILVAFAIAIDGVALVHGASVMDAVRFDGLGAMCLLFSRARFATIRDMLRRSATAHARLLEEVRAREQVELELRQAQKLEAIGRLASGIAHEINTPVQFVSDSVHFIGDATSDLLAFAAAVRAEIATGASLDEVRLSLAGHEGTADLTYVAAELPGAITVVRDGLERIATIVRSMKEFAHPDVRQLMSADLDRALLATITIAAHEYKLVADVDFVPGALPRVMCRPGEINQVFLNLLVNAAHAIADVVGTSGGRGTITIRTCTDGDHVVVTIADTGGGVPAAIGDRIFEPFFTTKEVGRGTGQGLAIAHNVVKHHGGTLGFVSTPGHGATFTVRLPILGQ